MKSINKKWFLTTLFLSAIIHFLVVYFAPIIVTFFAMNKMSETMPENAYIHNPIAYAGKDKIVRTSPDILYSTSIYNVLENPVRYSFSIPKDGVYASLSLYDGKNSDNIYSINDRIAKKKFPGAKEISVVIKKIGAKYQTKENEEVVEVANAKGILLCRTVIKNRYNKAETDSLVDNQKKGKVEKIIL